MTSLHRNDRREFQRYRTDIGAELITETRERVPCTLLDISPSGASVLCEPIADDVVVRLWLQEFGEIEAVRLRSAAGVERFLFRNTEFRKQQLIRFLGMLVDAGAALPATHRRENPPSGLSLASDRGPADADDALAFRVMQAINLVAQLCAPSANLPGNVVPFPVNVRSRKPTEPPPDRSA